MTTNVGTADRLFRIILGVALICFAIPIGFPQTGWTLDIATTVAVGTATQQSREKHSQRSRRIVRLPILTPLKRPSLNIALTKKSNGTSDTDTYF